MVVDRLGERLPAGHDDRTLAVGERDHHRADARVGDDHPRCADASTMPFEGQEVDELGVRALDADGVPVLDQQRLLERELRDCAQEPVEAGLVRADADEDHASAEKTLPA